VSEQYYGKSEYWRPRTKPLKIEILELEKNKIKFAVEGQTHTLFDPLRMVLLEDEDVLFVAYKIEHPLKERVIFVLQTRKKEPLQVIREGIEKLRSKFSELKKHLIKAVDQKAKAPYFVPEKEWKEFVKENL